MKRHGVEEHAHLLLAADLIEKEREWIRAQGLTPPQFDRAPGEWEDIQGMEGEEQEA